LVFALKSTLHFVCFGSNKEDAETPQGHQQSGFNPATPVMSKHVGMGERTCTAL